MVAKVNSQAIEAARSVLEGVHVEISRNPKERAKIIQIAGEFFQDIEKAATSEEKKRNSFDKKAD